jgi:hypothetical protein
MRVEDAAAVQGVVLAREVDEPALVRARAQGAVERVRRGAYLPVQDSRGAGRDERRRLLARTAAVHRQLRTTHWFSHESAAVLLGCDAVRVGGAVDVTQEGRPDVATPGIIRHHGGVLEADRATAHGLPVTGLARTLVDCASTLPEDRGLVVADSALRLGAAPDRVAEILSAGSGRRGIARARRVLALADGRSQSPGETLVRLHLHRSDIPTPDLQVRVGTRRGTFFLDLGWPSRRVALEFDGFVKYSGELGGTAPEVVFAEKQRQDAIEDEGWRVLRATWSDLREPALLATRVRRALAAPPR